ncbi:TRAP transporter small permease subunit [Roseospira navarrensis]|uniref:TRAP transporter small permease protein n=1 Tax=Roseospira navarrensis TaxID=140058 RepID=A0A7X1ZCC9_9PROT|nr:TRAP transporter small permease subunit [Roseospira navarrensis]MQX35757.1 TRAP transporter small permease subunit [Roseospira navarrensis]
MPRPIVLYVQVVDWVSHKFGLLAMCLIFVMMAVLLLDAFTRNVVNIPLHWCIEMAQFILAAYYFVGGAHSLQLGDHVRMDLIYDRLSERGKAWMDVVTSSFMIFYLVCLLIGAVSSTLYSLQYNQKLMSVWAPPLAPIKIIMVFGIVLMLLQVLSVLFKDLATARGVTIPGVRMHEETAV